MAEIKWVKLMVDMFDDEKIKVIQALPDGDALLVVWIKLILLAGKTNDDGYVYITESMPFTEDMLSIVMNKPISVIKLAMETFVKLEMIEIDTKGIYLINFEKHQSLEKMEKLKEQNRNRVAKYREKKKIEQNSQCNVTEHYAVMQCNAIEEDKEEDIDNNIYISSNYTSNDAISINDMFEILWKKYPKKISKAESLKQFKLAIKDGCKFEDIEKGLDNYIIYIKQNKIENKYIKQGSTWFNHNSKHWNDEYDIKDASIDFNKVVYG